LKSELHSLAVVRNLYPAFNLHLLWKGHHVFSGNGTTFCQKKCSFPEQLRNLSGYQ
jgi:hypothetical protein